MLRNFYVVPTLACPHDAGRNGRKMVKHETNGVPRHQFEQEVQSRECKVLNLKHKVQRTAHFTS